MWPANVHMVGKDILRFHAVYWPALLMAAGLEPPKRVFAHGWWTNDGQKISKSLGNVIKPADLVQTYGLDQTRYFLMRGVAFGNDGDFSRKAMIDSINGHLANGLGNLAQRSLSMISKNCYGKVPQPSSFTDSDKALLENAQALPMVVRADMEVQAFHKALDHVWGVIGDANRYIDEQAPWVLRKTDPARMGTVLYVVAETLRHIAVLTQPFMPVAGGKLLDQLAVPTGQRDIASLSPAHALRPGKVLPKPEGVFPRYEEAPKTPSEAPVHGKWNARPAP